MPNTLEIYGQCGQTLAFAATALNKILVANLAAGGKVQPADAESLLRALQADGLIEGGYLLSLTASGRNHYAELRQYVTAPTIRLLEQFELDDIETTIRTLREITARATHEE